MDKANVNGVDLEYEVRGSGEPVLLIPTGPIADSFRPFVDDEAASRFQLVLYYQRGQRSSTPQPHPLSFQDHAADAAALLHKLGIQKAHVAGHSTGAVTALQLALDYPECVHSLVLLEPPLFGVPSTAAFSEMVAPSFAAYSEGRLEEAIAAFISAVCSLEWEECASLFDRNTTAGTAQVFADADNVFRSLLPALAEWKFGPEQAAAISQPTLSVVGEHSEPLFRESDERIRAWLPRVEVCRIQNVAHLLHIQRPQPLIERVTAFLDRHPLRDWASDPRVSLTSVSRP
jgi:3-oxoadipate enol-lactonase